MPSKQIALLKAKHVLRIILEIDVEYSGSEYGIKQNITFNYFSQCEATSILKLKNALNFNLKSARDAKISLLVLI